MTTTIDNLLTRAPARYGATPATSEASRLWEREKIASKQKTRDFCDVLDEAAAQILAAVRQGDAELIGRVVLAARDANLDRLADRMVGLEPDDDPENRPTPDVAAMRVLLAASVQWVAA